MASPLIDLRLKSPVADTTEIDNRLTIVENQVASITVPDPPAESGLTEDDVQTMIDNSLATLGDPLTAPGVVVDISVASGNATVSGTDFTTADTLQIVNASVTGRIVDLPMEEGTVAIVSAAANTKTVTIRRGTATLKLARNGFVIVYLDGTANYIKVLAASQTDPVTDERLTDLEDELRQFAVPMAGGDAEVFPIPVIMGDIIIPSGTFTFAGISTDAATGTTVYTLKRGATSLGTYTFSAAGTTCSFVSAGAATVPGSASDFKMEGPATEDATLAPPVLAVPYRRVR